MQTGQSVAEIPNVNFSSVKGHHASGKDANAPMAGGTDKLKHDTRAKVA
jgi:hypothetical protein